MTIDDPRDLSKTATGATVAGVDDLIEIEEETPSIPLLGEATAGLHVRKPIPPPKPPTRDSKPDEPAEEPSPPPSIPAPRARVISVGGGSTPPIPSGSAAAWTRPASQVPAAASIPPTATSTATAEPKPPTPAAPVDLRSKLGIPRAKSDPVRESAEPSDLDGLRIVPPPSLRVQTNPGSPPVHRVEASKPLLDGTALAAAASRRSPPPPGPPIPLPAVAPPKVAPPPATGAAEVQPSQPFQRAVPAPPAPASDPPSSEPRTPRPSARSRSGEPSPSRLAMDPSLFDGAGARPRSEPARLRGGTPRPRGSSPGYVAARAPGSPPRPTPRTPGNPSGAAGEVQRGDVPGPPRMPNFAMSAGASPVRAEAGAPRKSEPPVTASAIAVMRIIAVGSPTREPVLEVEDDLLEEDPEVLQAAEPEVSSTQSKLASPHAEVLEELADEDIAPDSSDPVDASAELRAANKVRRANAKAAPPAAPSAREVEVPKPPPPPPRKPKTPSLPTKTLPQAKRRQKRPWWEDVFGEDFVRTTFRYTDDQVRREVDFIEEALGVASGGVVLDLGCGPGHHSVELTSRGYGVVGYDLSLYQLALASEVANERGQKLNFLQGDMREMAFEEMFDGIFSWNTSFGYFEEEKNVHVVERVFRALRPGGMFLLDVVNRDFVAASSPCQLWYEGDACVCMDDMSLDFITSRMCVKRSIILDDGRTRELVYSIRVYSLHELGKILHGVGFRVTEASGHPSTPGVFFGEHSPRIIILAQKP